MFLSIVHLRNGIDCLMHTSPQNAARPLSPEPRDLIQAFKEVPHQS